MSYSYSSRRPSTSNIVIQSLSSTELSPENYAIRTRTFVEQIQSIAKNHLACDESFSLKLDELQNQEWFTREFRLMETAPKVGQIFYSILNKNQLHLIYTSDDEVLERHLDFDHALAKFMWTAMNERFAHTDACNCLPTYTVPTTEKKISGSHRPVVGSSQFPFG